MPSHQQTTPTARTDTRVVHCKKEAYDVFIARPSPFGNPFALGWAGDRTTVINKYREWILTQPHLLAQLPTLKGKRLGCWCFPKACHGDVLIELIHLLEHKP